MNTAQLIVLWYAGLIISTIFFLTALDKGSILYFIASIIVIAAILIYSLKPHPSAKRRRVFLAITPIITISLFIFGYIAYNSYKQGQIDVTFIDPDELHKLASTPIEQVDLVKANLETYMTGFAFEGQVRNHSTYILKNVEIEIIIFEGGLIVERKKLNFNVEIPKDEARYVGEFINFQTPVISEPYLWEKRFSWTSRILSAKGTPLKDKEG